MSSVSVLFVLERFLEEYPAESGEYGTISALGPASQPSMSCSNADAL
jgi:predicted naringenin-chalcone synthase